jgi:hypothetical protein
MQDNELVPGRQNVVARGPGTGTPHRAGGDRPVNPLKHLRKSGGDLLFRLTEKQTE